MLKFVLVSFMMKIVISIFSQNLFQVILDVPLLDHFECFPSLLGTYAVNKFLERLKIYLRMLICM